jgi:hypothetical protein
MAHADVDADSDDRLLQQRAFQGGEDATTDDEVGVGGAGKLEEVSHLHEQVVVVGARPAPGFGAAPGRITQAQAQGLGPGDQIWRQ